METTKHPKKDDGLDSLRGCLVGILISIVLWVLMLGILYYLSRSLYNILFSP